MKFVTLATLVMITAFSSMAVGHETNFCDSEAFSMVTAEIENAPSENKDAAIVEFQRAKEKSDVGDLEACAIHLENASKAAAVG